MKDVRPSDLHGEWRLRNDMGGAFYHEMTDREKAGWIVAARVVNATKKCMEKIDEARVGFHADRKEEGT